MAFKKPEKITSGTKILIYGDAGTKKSRFALTFPRNAYIDSDQGADPYYEEFSDNLVQVSDSTTFSEVSDDLDDLENMMDEFDTITIDSVTKIYQNQQHTALNIVEQRAMSAGRNKEAEGLSQKEWGKISLNSDKMLSKAFEFKKEGKNIILIAESKEIKETISDGNGGKVTRVIGLTPNAAKGIQFDVDLCLETVKDKKTGETVGVKVIKDRLGVTKEGEIIENPTYEIWKDAIEKRQKGARKVEKRNLENDLKKDENSIAGEDPQPIKDEISSIIKGLTKEQQNSLVTKLKDEHGTHKFNDVNDVDKLKSILKSVKSHK